MKNINNEISICIIDYSGSTDFFLRIAAADSNRKYIFISPILSVYFKSRKYKNVQVIIVHKWTLFLKKNKLNENFDYSKTREEYLELLNNTNKVKYHNILLDVCYNIVNENISSNINFLLWNGESIAGLVARHISSKNKKIKTLFFEISNLPNKLFVNSLGVNASSSLYASESSDFKSLNCEYDLEKYNEWKSNFINYKLKNNSNIPPQAPKGKKIQFYFFYDFLFSFFSFRMYSLDSIHRRLSFLKPKVKKNKKSIIFNNTIPNIDFLFLPLQVSNDSQLKINSDVNNIQALEIAIKRGYKLILCKPHPAEHDISYLIDWLKKNDTHNNILLSNADTYQLINSCQELLVINSTVGFEAMIFGKPVEFLGRTLYNKLDSKTLPYFILNYLINIDFFSNDKIENKEIEKIYSYRK